MSPADRTGSRTRIISERLGSTACGHIPRQSLAARDSETIKSSRNKTKSSLTIAKLCKLKKKKCGGVLFCAVFAVVFRTPRTPRSRQVGTQLEGV